MNSNIYRYSIIGETLLETLSELQQQFKVPQESVDVLMDKFDQVANKCISQNPSILEREKYDLAPAQITGVEHEFKFHEGIWSLTLKNVTIKNEWMELNTDALKMIAVTMDQNV